MKKTQENHPIKTDTAAEIIRRFNHYPPLNQQEVEIHEEIRRSLKDVALKLTDILPIECVRTREFALVLTDLENAMMHCNAAYARNKPAME